MTNIDKIRQKLLSPSQYAVIPMAHIGTPLPFPEWEIQDADGNGTGEYYSPKKLSEELGILLRLVPRLDGNWFLMRYSMDWDVLPQVEAFLESLGLSDPRKQDDGTLLEVSQLDFTAFTGNEYMIIPTHMAKDIPVSVQVEGTPA